MKFDPWIILFITMCLPITVLGDNEKLYSLDNLECKESLGRLKWDYEYLFIDGKKLTRLQSAEITSDPRIEWLTCEKPSGIVV